MTVNKKLILIGIVVAALIFALVGATLAFVNARTDDVYNTFGIGEIGVDIDENYDPDPDSKRVVKQVWLENTGSIDAYVRAMIVPTFRDGVSYGCDVDYSTVPDGYIKVTGPDEAGVFKLHLTPGWEENWHFNATDNSFCYRFILPARIDKNTPSVTSFLLLEVSRESTDNWQNLNVDILAEALQTGGEAAEEHLRTVWGVTRVDQNGTLHWD